MIIAVHNPVSGLGATRDRIDGLRRACASRGRELRVIATEGPGDVTRATAEAAALRPEAIALVGGDGSIGECAGAYADLDPDARPPLIVVPAGRGNSVYKALFADEPWERYLDEALEFSGVRAVDAAVIEETGRTWTLGFSLGYLRDCLDATRHFPGLKGRALYAAAGAWAAARPKSFDVGVIVDERPVYKGSSVLVAVGGGAFRGGRLQFFPGADLTDGLLDVLIVEGVGVRRFADVLRSAPSGAHLDLPYVHAFGGERVTLITGAPRAEVDGTPWEPSGPTISLRVLPGLLPVVTPAWASARGSP